MMARRQEYIVVICNSISLEIVLIWNYSYICWEKQVYLDEPGQSLDIECGGRDRHCTGGAATDGYPVLFDIFYLVQYLLDIKDKRILSVN